MAKTTKEKQVAANAVIALKIVRVMLRTMSREEVRKRIAKVRTIPEARKESA